MMMNNRVAFCLLLCFASSNGVWSAWQVPFGCYLHPSAKIVDLSSSERGILVEQDIAAEQVLLSIPLGRIITPDHGKTTPAGKALLIAGERSGHEIDEQTFCALWICHAINHPETLDKNSYLYLRTLPRTMDHVPVLWSETDLLELQGSQLLIETRAKQVQWENLYQTIASCFPTFGMETSIETFRWAKTVVGSRAFRLRENYMEDASILRGIGLVPLAGMLNHQSRSARQTCDWRVEKSNSMEAFVIRTSPDNGLCAGSEACHSYGLYSNAHYLEYYGFCLEANCRHDGMSPNEAHIEVMKEDHWPVLGLFKVTIGEPVVAKMLLSSLRCSVANLEEKETIFPRREACGENQGKDGRFPAADKTTVHWNLPYSIENERRAMRRLLKSVEKALALYSTTFEEDETLLMSTSSTGSFLVPPGSNRRNAMLVRSGEKRILLHWLLLCKASLVCLDDVESGLTTWEFYCSLLETTLRRTTSIAAASK